MHSTDYRTELLTSRSPREAFDAINNVGGWWSGDIEGTPGQLGAEFTYRVPGAHYCKMKVTEYKPGEAIAWHVLESHLDFAEPKSEWTGTVIRFELSRAGDQTKVRFSHQGLGPTFDCYDSCSSAWGMLIHKNLMNLIATGKNQPDVFRK